MVNTKNTGEDDCKGKGQDLANGMVSDGVGNKDLEELQYNGPVGHLLQLGKKITEGNIKF